MSIGPFQLLIILLIVFAIFGTKKLGSFGKDLGEAIKGFREAVNEDKDEGKQQTVIDQQPAGKSATELEKENQELRRQLAEKDKADV